MKSTNMLERFNQELKRRSRVIRIFPKKDSAHRMLGALLAERHEECSTNRKYFDMTEYWEWRAVNDVLFDKKLISIG